VDLCRKVVQGVGHKYPISVKLRLHENVSYTIDLMRRLWEVGVQAFALHARYFWQKGEARGNADWDALKTVKEAFSHLPITYLPPTNDAPSSSSSYSSSLTFSPLRPPIIIGNGDGYSYEDAQRMISSTGVHACMSGYGALLSPHTVFMKDPQVGIDRVISDYLYLAQRHINMLIDIQRHLAWMLKRYGLSVQEKQRLFQCVNLQEICDLLRNAEKPLMVQLQPLQEDEVDRIKYPPDPNAPMTKGQKRRLEKIKKNLARKSKRSKYQVQVKKTEAEAEPQDNDDDDDDLPIV